MEQLKQSHYTIVFVTSNVLHLTPREAYANCSLRNFFFLSLLLFTFFYIVSLDYSVPDE